MSALARLSRPALALVRPPVLARPLSAARVVLPMRPLSTAVGLRAAARTPLRSSVRTLGRRLNSTASEAAGTSGAGPEKPKSAYERFKELTKTYGSYAVIMYLALSAVDFTLSFAVVHAVGADRIEPAVDAITRWYRGIRHGKEGAEALEKADAAKKLADDAEEAADAVLRKNKTEAWYTSKTLWAEITLAYAIHKVGLLPLRAGLTVAWTPKVVNFLRARGWIGTSGVKRAAKHGADKVREASQRAVDKAKDAVKRAE